MNYREKAGFLVTAISALLLLTACGSETVSRRDTPRKSNIHRDIQFQRRWQCALCHTVTVRHGGTVSVPAAPTRAGHDFDGWYSTAIPR